MAQNKFSKYYGRTWGIKGELYAVAAILDPSLRMSAYDPAHWEKHEIAEYRDEILQFYENHYLQYEDGTRPQSPINVSTVQVTILGNEPKAIY